MDNAIKPFAVACVLSLAIHGMAVAAVLLLPGEAMPLLKGVGPGFEIDLVSSKKVADNDVAENISGKKTLEQGTEKALQEILAVHKSRRDDVLLETAIKNGNNSNKSEQPPVSKSVQREMPEEYATQLNQATNASQQQHSITELLHSRISENKAYPYLARRQRREGVVTIEFVLHPNGKIENVHLISSSRTRALDREALSAVKKIEPFFAAKNYLKQSEKFQVDVTFFLL